MKFETETDFLKALKDNEEAAVIYLVNEYSNSILYIIHNKFSVNEDDAMELVQDVLFIIIKKASTIDIKKKFYNFIYEIAKNKALDWFKKNSNKFHGELLEYLEEVYSHNLQIEADNEEIESTNKLNMVMLKVIERMKDHEIDLIKLRLKDFSFKEIGEMLGKKEDTVKVNHYRYLNKLKKKCNELLEEEKSLEEVKNG